MFYRVKRFLIYFAQALLCLGEIVGGNGQNGRNLGHPGGSLYPTTVILVPPLDHMSWNKQSKRTRRVVARSPSSLVQRRCFCSWQGVREYRAGQGRAERCMCALSGAPLKARENLYCDSGPRFKARSTKRASWNQ